MRTCIYICVCIYCIYIYLCIRMYIYIAATKRIRTSNPSSCKLLVCRFGNCFCSRLVFCPHFRFRLAEEFVDDVNQEECRRVLVAKMDQGRGIDLPNVKLRGNSPAWPFKKKGVL